MSERRPPQLGIAYGGRYGTRVRYGAPRAPIAPGMSWRRTAIFPALRFKNDTSRCKTRLRDGALRLDKGGLPMEAEMIVELDSRAPYR